MYSRRKSQNVQGAATRNAACWSGLLATLALMAHAVTGRGAEDDPVTSKADVLAKKRLETMHQVIDDFRVRSSQIESPEALKFSPRPLLRYSDQSREGDLGTLGVLDATVWRLGETGRPTAVVALEIYHVRDGNPLLNYECMSFSNRKFEMTSPRGPRWFPSGSALAMEPLADSPAPAQSPKSRLTQLRQLSRRFTVQEELRGEKIECRLLPQPIDRYDDMALGILDGAIFVFANGTNPEMGLVLECSEQQWTYGVFRCTGARLFAQLDGKSFLDSQKPANQPDAPRYVASHTIILPE
jgi:hypothetical protein